MASNTRPVYERADKYDSKSGLVSEDAVLAAIGTPWGHRKNVSWNNMHIAVRPLLNPKDYIDTVRTILDECSTEDGGFAVELMDFSMRVNIICAYAMVELPKDFDTLYYTVYESGLYEAVCRAVNSAQLDAIRNAVEIYIKNQ